MKRERYLHRRLHTLETLEEAVSAMRSLSAHHFRLSRQALPAARAYRNEIEQALADVGISQSIDFTAPPGILLVASDLGLCADYNTRLVHAAFAELEHQGPGPVYCVGRRPKAILAGRRIESKRQYRAPASVDGLPGLLLQLAQDLLDDLLQKQIGSLFAISARFDGAGLFSPTVTRLLPIQSAAPPATPLHSSKYQSHRHLTAVAIREFLYTTLHELLLDSLASEHGMRLLAAESARQWLEDTANTVRRQLSACRREATTQEVLDIVAGAKARRLATV